MKLVYLLMAGFMLGCTFMHCDPSGAGTPLLSPDKAKQAASRGFATRLPALPEAYHRAAAETVVGDPLLVHRLDREDREYYIVPFLRDELTTILVVVDARSGDFRETSFLQEPGIYPPVSQTRALSALTDTLGEESVVQETPQSPPELVWKPCEQSQSVYEPLWRFRVDEREWFVDQTGAVHDRILEIQIKGGGPPDR